MAERLHILDPKTEVLTETESDLLEIQENYLQFIKSKSEMTPSEYKEKVEKQYGDLLPDVRNIFSRVEYWRRINSPIFNVSSDPLEPETSQIEEQIGPVKQSETGTNASRSHLKVIK